MKRLALATALIFAASFNSASLKAADDAAPWGKVREACKADREKLCADAKGEEGPGGKCLRDHKSELSADCASALAAMEENREKMRQACSADIDKTCADQKGKGRKVVECLRDHVADLQPACAEFIKSHIPAKAQ